MSIGSLTFPPSLSSVFDDWKTWIHQTQGKFDADPINVVVLKLSVNLIGASGPLITDVLHGRLQTVGARTIDGDGNSFSDGVAWSANSGWSNETLFPSGVNFSLSKLDPAKSTTGLSLVATYGGTGNTKWSIHLTASAPGVTPDQIFLLGTATTKSVNPLSAQVVMSCFRSTASVKV